MLESKHRYMVQLKESVPGLTRGRQNMVLVPARSEAEAKRMVLSKASRFGVQLTASDIVTMRQGREIT